MVTVQRVNPKDFVFNRYMVAVTAGLKNIEALAQESWVSDRDCKKHGVSKCCIWKPKIVSKMETVRISAINPGLRSGRALPRF